MLLNSYAHFRSCVHLLIIVCACVSLNLRTIEAGTISLNDSCEDCFPLNPSSIETLVYKIRMAETSWAESGSVDSGPSWNSSADPWQSQIQPASNDAQGTEGVESGERGSERGHIQARTCSHREVVPLRFGQTAQLASPSLKGRLWIRNVLNACSGPGFEAPHPPKILTKSA